MRILLKIQIIQIIGALSQRAIYNPVKQWHHETMEERRTIQDMQTPRPDKPQEINPSMAVLQEVRAALADLREVIERGGTEQEMAKTLKAAAVLALAAELVGGKGSTQAAASILKLAAGDDPTEGEQVIITRRIVDDRHPD